MKIIPVSGTPIHILNVKRDHVLFSSNFEIGLHTAIPLKRARRELCIDMAVGVPTLNCGENATGPRFTFTPLWV